MLIVGENEVYFLDRDDNVFEVTGLRFVYRKNLNQHLTNTLVDGVSNFLLFFFLYENRLIL